jgi:hypothetical protein
MGNACNCVSKEDPKNEEDLTKKSKPTNKNDKGKKQNHDDSNLEEGEGDERPNMDDPELADAALKIQVHNLLRSRSIVDSKPRRRSRN